MNTSARIKNGKWLFIFLPLFLVASPNWAQEQEVPEKNIRLFALPLVYYTPETTWSFGGAGVMAFALDSLSPTSQLQLGLAYTLRNQVLIYLPFQLYFKADQWRLTGELGYYRYNYFYYGIGNEFEDYEGETYGVNFPRVRINLLRRLSTHQLAGLRYYLDDWSVYDIEEGGLLADPATPGQQGSVYSAIGPLWQWDSRDHIFFPSRGWWAEAALLFNTSLLGATQEFTKWTVDVRTYRSRKDKHVWAAQLYLEGNTGQPAFNQLALLGGTRLLRGYYEGRYRDRQLAAAQVEYRFPIYRRFGAVAFAGMGSVTDAWKNWQTDYLRWAVGAGVRFTLLPKDKIRLRLDYGIGPNTSAFYLTVGESF